MVCGGMTVSALSQLSAGPWNPAAPFPSKLSSMCSHRRVLAEHVLIDGLSSRSRSGQDGVLVARREIKDITTEIV